MARNKLSSSPVICQRGGKKSARLHWQHHRAHHDSALQHSVCATYALYTRCLCHYTHCRCRSGFAQWRSLLYYFASRRKSQWSAIAGSTSISDLSGKPAVDMWSFFMTGGRKIRLSAKSCLRYGKLPEGAKTAAGMPAPELQSGRVYSIFLNGRPNDPSDPTYGYRGKFCIMTAPSGDRKIIAIGSDTQVWKDDICPSPPPSK